MAERVEVEDVAGRLGPAAMRLARLLRQRSKGELTPTVLAVLGTILREGPLTLGDVAAIEGLAPPTITKAVATLEASGYVERRIDEADRRVSWVTVSDAGRRWVEEERARRRQWLASRLDRLDPDHLGAVVAALDALEALAVDEPADQRERRRVAQ